MRDFEAAKAEGKTHKIWRTVGDDDVRGSHAAMDRVRIGIDGSFDVGGETLFLPSDPDASFAETANCRCFVEYVEEQEDRGDAVNRPLRREDLAVDDEFLDDREGLRLNGYIPQKNNRPIDDSGVTVGGGVDLGQHDEAGLRSRGISEALIEKVRPFLGLRTDAAKRFLQENPLRLTQQEAQILTDRVRGGIAVEVARNFNRDSHLRFEKLPPEAQTVIASVATQYGANLGQPNAAPKFWRSVTNGDWQSALDELLDFGDDFTSRRKAEAEKLLEAFPNLVVSDNNK